MEECPHYNIDTGKCTHPKHRKLQGCWECPNMAKLDKIETVEMENHRLYDLED